MILDSSRKFLRAAMIVGLLFVTLFSAQNLTYAANADALQDYNLGPNMGGITVDTKRDHIWVVTNMGYPVWSALTTGAGVGAIFVRDKDGNPLKEIDDTSGAQASGVGNQNIIAYDPSNDIVWFNNVGNPAIRGYDAGTYALKYTYKNSSTVALTNLAIDPVSNSIWFGAGTKLFKTSAATGAVSTYDLLSGYPSVGSFSGVVDLSFDNKSKAIWALVVYSDTKNKLKDVLLVKVDPSTGTALSTYSLLGLGFNDSCNENVQRIVSDNAGSLWVAGANPILSGKTITTYYGDVCDVDAGYYDMALKIDTASGKVIGTYKGSVSSSAVGVGGMTFDARTNSIWTAFGNVASDYKTSTGNLVQLNTADASVSSMSAYPFTGSYGISGILIDPVQKSLWLTSNGETNSSFPMGSLGNDLGLTHTDVDGHLTEVSVANTITGTVNVSANLSGASWTITGPATLTGSGTSKSYTSQPAGTYTIVWNAVAGYATPASQLQSIASNGSTITFSGTYTQNPAVNLYFSFVDTLKAAFPSLFA
jgi:hypothetical protein